MGDKKFTLFELHIDGETQVGPSVLPDSLLGGAFGTTETAESTRTDEEGESADADDGGGRGAIAVVVGLIAVVAIGLAVRKFRGGEEEEEPLGATDERDVVVS